MIFWETIIGVTSLGTIDRNITFYDIITYQIVKCYFFYIFF